jgi:hypothetical protein
VLSVCNALVKALDRYTSIGRGRHLFVSVAGYAVSVAVVDIAHHLDIVVLRHVSVESYQKSDIKHTANSPISTSSMPKSSSSKEARSLNTNRYLPMKLMMVRMITDTTKE